MLPEFSEREICGELSQLSELGDLMSAPLEFARTHAGYAAEEAREVRRVLKDPSNTTPVTFTSEPTIRTRTRTGQFFSSLKPMCQCVPSQNGLFFEPPQRHSV